MKEEISMCSVGRGRILWLLLPGDGQQPSLIRFVPQSPTCEEIHTKWDTSLSFRFGTDLSNDCFFHSEKRRSAQFQLWIYKWDSGTVCSSQHRASEKCLASLEYRFRRCLQFPLYGRGRVFPPPTMKDYSVSSRFFCSTVKSDFFVWLFFIFCSNVRIMKL